MAGGSGGAATPLPAFDGSVGDSLAPGALPTIRLTSSSGGDSVPFSVGQVFRRGDVPAGHAITANLAGFQAVIRNRWPDGSAKTALLSGRSALAAGQTGVLQLQKQAGDPVTAAPRDLASLIARAPQARIDLAPFGSSSLGALLGNPHRQTVAGAQMSEWIFREAIGADPHLTVWWRVRDYGGSDIDILVGVENGFLRVANPARKDYRAVVTINGQQRLAADIQHFHHTRWAAQYWYGTDRTVVPAHNGRYLSDTKLFPNYGWRSPSDRALDALKASTTPFARNEFPDSIGTAGFHPSIGLLPVWDALYVTSEDARAWRAMLANSYSYGRYGVHFRDEATAEPARLAQHPNLVIDDTTGIGATGSSGTNDYTAGAVQNGVPTWLASHHPAPPYAAALLTGEWWLIEQVQFVASTNALYVTDAARGFGDGYILTFIANNERGAAWRLRTLAMAATATPDDWQIQTEYRRQWSSAMKFFADLHVRGTLKDGRFVNRFGIFQSQPDFPVVDPKFGTWWGPGWMQAFLQAAIGFAWDMDVGARDDHRLVRDFAYQLTAGLMGDAGGWDYRRAGVYDMPFGMSPLDQTIYYPNFGAMLAHYESSKQIASIANLSDTILRRHSSDGPGYENDFALGYWGNHQPARAYAVEHGAPGALAGYRRIVNAANYRQMLQELDDIPVWGILPRSTPTPSE